MLLLAGNLTHMSKFQVAVSRAVQGLHAGSLLKSPENQFSLNSITQSSTYLKWLSLIGGSLKFSKFSSASLVLSEDQVPFNLTVFASVF